MQSTAIEITPTRPPEVVMNRQFGTRRSMPLRAVSTDNATTMVEHVLNNAHLDTETRKQMVRILSVTVREWGRQ
jgi:hypothetical protein